MTSLTTIDVTTASGLRFTAYVAGPEDGPLVLLLHGFPESRRTWHRAVERLGAGGYRAVAPDQRGYSPGARPDPSDLSNYAFSHLVADAVAIADVVGVPVAGSISWATTGVARCRGASRRSTLSDWHR